jgi:hypothetical protein
MGVGDAATYARVLDLHFRRYLGAVDEFEKGGASGIEVCPRPD